jgi:hypothetical protein
MPRTPHQRWLIACDLDILNLKLPETIPHDKWSYNAFGLRPRNDNPTL